MKETNEMSIRTAKQGIAFVKEIKKPDGKAAGPETRAPLFPAGS
jgi:hypothetical protein